MPKPKIVVLISGSGTNLQALINATASGVINGTISQVISSSPGVMGLTRAETASIPIYVHDLQGKYYAGVPKEDKASRKEARQRFNVDLAAYILQDKPDLVVCAGWMLILAPSFLAPLEREKVPIINLHPALPGAFAGTHAIERAWEAGQRGEITKAGVMIHKVITEVDEGEPLLIKELQLSKEETLDDYEARLHAVEHIAIVEGTNIALKELCGF
ncbi:phosphoribosyl-glycinamide transformylase [Nadsonia fulvescens var. elongata DSM 6958]|uniref:Phosphoribosylglycinamide formyltransferase n=1 Tax=Nadsonia fulvescens var. elongata DSM 6958 TaxID=857566 RepID=A0A1E3PJC0_9ASCO|nr:phosphoribosyl-glycinamide transformylase [Nadsonia fulvescens var. elongata DSM 6958]